MVLKHRKPGICILGQKTRAMRYRKLDEDDQVRCLECGEPIRYGRADKKFCSCGCKNMYHNRTRHEVDRLRANVMAKLKANYEVLVKMLWGDRSNAKIEELSAQGFDPAFFTVSRKEGRHREFECYDIVYYMTEKKVFNVHRVDHGFHSNRYICSENSDES